MFLVRAIAVIAVGSSGLAGWSSDLVGGVVLRAANQKIQ
jgi:hypothetical protein